MRPGFTHPVFDAQACFAALMEAMARPGRIQECAVPQDPPEGLHPAAAAALLTLVDAETLLWTDARGEARDWIIFHTGAVLTEEPGHAHFVLALHDMPTLGTLNAGSDEGPQGSATLILQVMELEERCGWRLTGPGIRDAHDLHAHPMPSDFPAQWAANRALFPRGVDLLLCAGTRLAAMPRGTQIAPMPHGTGLLSVPHGTGLLTVPHGTGRSTVPHGTGAN